MRINIAAIALIVAVFAGVEICAADLLEERPFFAIWRDWGGDVGSSQAPYLRLAIWNDGRIMFARDPKKWGHDLLKGRIEASRVAELKKAIEATGVFDLKGTCYLVPDAPVDCMMLDFGAKQQMLYWDEIDVPNYGINVFPKPHHRDFKNRWKEVNKLALSSIPPKGEPYDRRFHRPPSWRLKPPIQSE